MGQRRRHRTEAVAGRHRYGRLCGRPRPRPAERMARLAQGPAEPQPDPFRPGHAGGDRAHRRQGQRGVAARIGRRAPCRRRLRRALGRRRRQRAGVEPASARHRQRQCGCRRAQAAAGAAAAVARPETGVEAGAGAMAGQRPSARRAGPARTALESCRGTAFGRPGVQWPGHRPGRQAAGRERPARRVARRCRGAVAGTAGAGHHVELSA